VKVNGADAAAITLTLLDELKLYKEGKVSTDVVRKKWSEVGLREDDLELGLEQLLSQQALVEKSVGEEKCYALTSVGYNNMVKLNSPFSFGMASYQRLRRNSMQRLEDRKAISAQILEDRRRKQA